MRWLADECVAAALVGELRSAGHDVAYMAEVAPRASDADVIRRANDEDRLLLTEDKDFGELVFRWGRAVPGIVLVRIHPGTHQHTWRRLQAAIGRFGDALFGRYTVVESSRFRARPLPLIED